MKNTFERKQDNAFTAFVFVRHIILETISWKPKYTRYFIRKFSMRKWDPKTSKPKKILRSHIFPRAISKLKNWVNFSIFLIQKSFLSVVLTLSEHGKIKRWKCCVG